MTDQIVPEEFEELMDKMMPIVRDYLARYAHLEGNIIRNMTVLNVVAVCAGVVLANAPPNVRPWFDRAVDEAVKHYEDKPVTH